MLWLVDKLKRGCPTGEVIAGLGLETHELNLHCMFPGTREMRPKTDEYPQRIAHNLIHSQRVFAVDSADKGRYDILVDEITTQRAGFHECFNI